MVQQINEPVEVLVAYKRGAKAFPKIMEWQHRIYRFRELGFVHPTAQGRRMLHIFTLTDGNMTYRLEFDAESLNWKLAEISDGLPA